MIWPKAPIILETILITGKRFCTKKVCAKLYKTIVWILKNKFKGQNLTTSFNETGDKTSHFANSTKPFSPPFFSFVVSCLSQHASPFFVPKSLQIYPLTPSLHLSRLSPIRLPFFFYWTSSSSLLWKRDCCYQNWRSVMFGEIEFGALEFLQNLGALFWLFEGRTLWIGICRTLSLCFHTGRYVC